ncbi:unnamed protein product [Rotaria sp. Silwood2]|nr:unnamed protein product [Rotaria sp. Silwood2]
MEKFTDGIPNIFIIIHYAGKVRYSADQWLMKNMDPLNDSVVGLLQRADDRFIQEIWKDTIIWRQRSNLILPNTVIMLNLHDLSNVNTNDTTSTSKGNIKKGRFRTVGELYKQQLKKLMSILKNTYPNFVRCILPNEEKKAAVINSPFVLNQLHCNGVLEGIRICRNGFPNRISFQEFCQRYDILCPNIILKGFMDSKTVSQEMIKQLKLDEGKYRIGLTKIFFRADVLSFLEEKRDLKLANIITQLQALSRAVLTRKYYQRRIQKWNLVCVMQQNPNIIKVEDSLPQKQEEMRRMKAEIESCVSREQESKQQLQIVQQEKDIVNDRLANVIEALKESDEVDSLIEI